ncbi:MAG: Gfo/Idh/MocA family oxidoreductase [Elainella sp. Prado103]|jgi:biliverdin reductase|nr:Gfo/Idh/MocA family oxidoreductase [Elainella sp. Prado103]
MHPIRVGIVGTGYAAKARAESLQFDPRSQLVAIAGGRNWSATQQFAASYGAEAVIHWSNLIDRDLDLILIANLNGEHSKIVRAALAADKHVVVEYPLAIDYTEAIELAQLAQCQNRLLHVEHIELLSGIHQAVKLALPELGIPFYSRYTSLNSQHPAPHKWTYSLPQFGFPLIGAVSRIHRLTDLFGAVTTVHCQARFWQRDAEFYHSCLCTAQFKFASGLVAELTYGKGEAIWQSLRALEIHGEHGAIFVNGDQGQLVNLTETRSLNLGTRRGLFAKDTASVLDYLTVGAPLYVSLDASLSALQVADAARRSAESGQPIHL